MPFSVKMRELMVWTTNTVLPVLAGLSGDVADGMVSATPGECPLFSNASKVSQFAGGMTQLMFLLVCPLHINVYQQSCFVWSFI